MLIWGYVQGEISMRIQGFEGMRCNGPRYRYQASYLCVMAGKIQSSQDHTKPKLTVQNLLEYLLPPENEHFASGCEVVCFVLVSIAKR